MPNGGPTELIVDTTKGITGYDPDTGKKLWNWEWVFKQKTVLRTTGSPVCENGILFANAGDSPAGPRHAVAIKLGDPPTLLWENLKDFPYISSLLAYNNHVYFVSDDGMAGCYEAATGKRVWLNRLEDHFSSSPILIDGKIYVVNDYGDVFVFAADPSSFKQLAKNSLGETVCATPAGRRRTAVHSRLPAFVLHRQTLNGKRIMPTNAPLNRKLRMGLVGGGQGAFIGRVHATAAILDNRAALVAGALSSDPAKAKASAPDYDIKPERAYGSYQEMVAGEPKLPASERIDFVSVATPNHTHFEIAKAFAEAGFNVMCDKPLTFDLAQAEELAKVVSKTGVVFAVTHNYTGYPLVRQARDMVKGGELGEINAIRAFYIQGWLRTRLEVSGSQEAGELAHRPETIRCRRLLRRHRHACLQPGPLHHRPDSRIRFPAT